MFKTHFSSGSLFVILCFGHLNLSFDLAQDGELTEPFSASDFEFRIFQSPYTL